MRYITYDNQKVSQIDFFDLLINNLNVNSLIHGRSVLKKDWNHKNIRSPFHRLYFILGGSGTIEGDNVSIDLLPGHVYLIPAGSTWSYSCDSELIQFFIHLKVNLTGGIDIFQNCRDCLVLSYPTEEIRRAIDSVEKGSLGNIISFKSFIFDIIARFVIENQIELEQYIEKNMKYQELFRYIKSRQSAELKVSHVVDYMKTSHSALYKDLKSDTGYSIKYYINKHLTELSCELLLFTELSIKQIAWKLDFKDQYYFSRFFKKQTGSSPLDYRTDNSSKL